MRYAYIVFERNTTFNSTYNNEVVAVFSNWEKARKFISEEGKKKTDWYKKNFVMVTERRMIQ